MLQYSEAFYCNSSPCILKLVMALRAMGMMCVLALAILIFAQLPVPGHAFEAQLYMNAIEYSAGPIFDSVTESMISIAEKTEPDQPLAQLNLAVMSIQAISHLMDTAFLHGTDGSWEINQEIEQTLFEATVKARKFLHKVYAAAAKAQTAVDTLLTVQEILKRRPGHSPALKELQIVIDSASLNMADKSIETHLDDVLSAYARLIKQCQTDTTANANERQDVVSKMLIAGAVGGVGLYCAISGAVGLFTGGVGVYWALSGKVYTMLCPTAMVKGAISLSHVLKLKKSLTIIQERIKYLRECEDEAKRLRSSLSADIHSWFQTLQSKLENMREATTSDLRMQDGMKRFLSPDITGDLNRYHDDLLKLQDACSQLINSTLKKQDKSNTKG